MRKLPFKSSRAFTLGVELEFQIIDPVNYELVSRAKDLIRIITESHYKEHIKPEITQSMIEINSSIQNTPLNMYRNLLEMRDFLLDKGNELGILFSGGGTHPFHKWALQKIFPSTRFKQLSRIYRYLSKRSAVFGQHIHIGCSNSDDAIYLTHALARYVPHFVALSASSPFYQGIDTKFQSSRSTVFNAFPLSGVIPLLTTWEEFSDYFYKMRNLGIIRTMKDFYWDIRPKPEFGTVEVRVFDTPLTIKKAVLNAAYLQTLSHYLLRTRPIKITPDLYYIYHYNKFQASRYGYEGELVDPTTLNHCLLRNDILNTINLMQEDATQLNNTEFLSEIINMVNNNESDATMLQEIYKNSKSLKKVVSEQCLLWKNNL